MDARFESDQKAVDIYSSTNNEWKETHNNLQRQLTEQQSTFVTRKELWLACVAVAAIVVSILALILKK